MVFSSIPFLFFFMPLVLICYFLVPFKYKNYCLLIFSLLFYAWGEPIYIFLMLFSTLVDYTNGLLLTKNPKKKKRYLFTAILINLSLLGFFKYSDFLISVINSLFNVNIPLLNIALPIGISFYTFQTMSYSIDVYKGKVKPEKNYFYYLTYVSMFPQLIAGPIVRYETISQELYKREINFNNVSKGMIRFLQGLFKKVLIGNNIGYLFNLISTTPINELSILTIWLGIIAFSLQIYFDFSGYSDMAIGIGKMLGFDFLENFNYPYISKSITEFWRRWHISLSSFFRDYIYIPLGGSRVKRIINIRNIMIVWCLTGLWHGASINFVIWGLYYGILLLIEKFIIGKRLEKWPNIIRHLYTIILVLIGWFIFAFDDINILKEFFGSAIGFNGLPLIDNNFIYYLLNYGLIIIIGIIFSTPIYKLIDKKLKTIKNNWLNIIISILTILIYVGLFIITIAYLVSDTYNPFLYFRF